MAPRSRNSCGRRVALAVSLIALSLACERRPAPLPDAAASSPHAMTPQEFQALPGRAPDGRVAYGADSSQYGELRVPSGASPHSAAWPVVESAIRSLLGGTAAAAATGSGADPS